MNKLEKVLQQVFPKINLSLGSELKLGCCEEWDSLGNFNLLIAVEEEFNMRFSAEEISEIKTLIQLQECLLSRGVEV